MRKSLLVLFLSACGASKPSVSTPVRAQELAHEYIIVDGHIDVPWRLWDSRDKKTRAYTEDISMATEKGEFDYPRAVKGGLDAPFMSIYVPSDFQPPKGGAKQMADILIDMVEGFTKNAPEKFAIATTPDEVIANTKAGKISLPMGIENGAALEGKLINLQHFYDRGVRYITLTHGKDNDICDSSFDETGTHKGLSPFGKEVVKEMNRLGIMIDVSHISDRAFAQVIELTKVPVIASHSSMRHFVPGFERNMSDDMVKALAKNGGVVMINFGSAFLTKPINEARTVRREAANAFAAKMKLEEDDPAVDEFLKEYDQEHGVTYATVEIVADHIDHVVKLVGIDHVGIGSDFDGVGDSLPEGLKSVADYPNLIRVLLERGYKEEDIEKICSGNVFRVWNKVTEFAVASSGAAKPAKQ